MAHEVPERLQRFQARTDPWLLGLALLFLLVWTVMLVERDTAGADLQRPLQLVLIAIWAIFVADIVIRAVLSRRPGRYLVTHPIDLLVVFVPVAQPLKLLAVFASGAALATKRGRLAGVRAVLISLFLVMWAGAAAELALERDAPGATITTFGDALWWAPVTVFSVGYGDMIPVTLPGRLVAVIVMGFGIALLGVVTASVAAWFLSTRHVGNTAPAGEHAHLEERIVSLEAKIDALLEQGALAPSPVISHGAVTFGASTPETAPPAAVPPDAGSVGFGVAGSRE